jgi:integrase
MALFKHPGKKTWWYEFHFGGQKVRESAKTRSKEMARRAELARRRDLEGSYHGLKKRAAPKLFNAAADDWLALKKPTLADRSYQIEGANLKHLRPVFGKQLITDIDGKEISAYQQKRLEEKASPKTVNLEIGTLRAILRRNRLWAEIQPDVRMLPTRDDIGRAVSPEEEKKLLAECGQSRSRSLLPAVTLALNTCMRYSEIRLLRWLQVDFAARTLTVGKSKSDSGTGRVIPLNTRAWAVLEFWASNFPDRHPTTHYVFPAERYGAAGRDFKACAYDTDPTNPLAAGRKLGKPQRPARACNAGSMIFGTPGVRACWKLAYRSPCWRCLWAGVRRPLCAWRSATAISGSLPLEKRLKRSLLPPHLPPPRTQKSPRGPLTIPLT